MEAVFLHTYLLRTTVLKILSYKQTKFTQKLFFLISVVKHVYVSTEVFSILKLASTEWLALS